MIYPSLSFLCSTLNSFIALKDPLSSAGTIDKPVILSNIVDQGNKLFRTGGDYIYMTLVNTEEETVGKSMLAYSKSPEDKLYTTNPEIKLNLYIQFAAFSDTALAPSAYERSLLLLDQVVFFFQYRSVFNNSQYPALMSSGIEKLVVEPVSLTFEQLNHLWATLGAKYMPSVIYKCRMLPFQEQVVASEKQLIKEISTISSGNLI
jgi:hypothetical protein